MYTIVEEINGTQFVKGVSEEAVKIFAEMLNFT